MDLLFIYDPLFYYLDFDLIFGSKSSFKLLRNFEERAPGLNMA